MYGREKSAVVKPTNAVSATRNTLKGSTKKSLSRTSSGPPAITRAVSAAAATNVARLAATLTTGACSRWPTSASSAAPASGMPRTNRISIMRLRRPNRGPRPCAWSAPSTAGARFDRTGSSFLGLLQLLEVLEVEAVELLADLEEEHAEDQHADQHVERDAELDDHRHAVGRAGRGEEQAVLHRQEADHLRDRLAPRDHHQERKHDARHR